VELEGMAVLYAALDTHRRDVPCVRWAIECLEGLCITPQIRIDAHRLEVLFKIFKIMDASIAEAEIQQACCRLLARFAQTTHICLDIIAKGGFVKVVRAMTQHPKDIDCQLYACWALVEIAGGQADAQDLEKMKQRQRMAISKGSHENLAQMTKDQAAERGEAENTSVVSAVLKSMQKHLNVADVQRYGCKALENLGSRNNAERVAVAKENGVQIMLKGMRVHSSDGEVLGFGFHAMAVLGADDAKMHEHIVQMEAADYAISTCKTHWANKDALANICRLMANLALTRKCRDYVLSKGVLDFMFNALKEYSSSVDISHFASCALRNLAIDDKVCATIAKRGVGPILKALDTLSGDEDVQVSGISLLERVSRSGSNNQTLSSDRVVRHIVAMLRKYKESMDVLSTAMAALATLSGHPKNKESVMNSEGYTEVIWALREFSEDVKLCEYGCGILSNLAFKNAKDKAILSKSGAVDIVVRVMAEHLFSAPVQQAGCSFLRNFTANSEIFAKKRGSKAP